MTKDTPNTGWNASSHLFDQTIENKWLGRIQPPISTRIAQTSTVKPTRGGVYCALWLLPITYSCYLMIVATQHRSPAHIRCCISTTWLLLLLIHFLVVLCCPRWVLCLFLVSVSPLLPKSGNFYFPTAAECQSHLPSIHYVNNNKNHFHLIKEASISNLCLPTTHVCPLFVGEIKFKWMHSSCLG
jgi:hypothetical protein